MGNRISYEGHKIRPKEMNAVLKDDEIKELVFMSAINWMATMLALAREISTELPPRIVVCLNELEDAIERRENLATWTAYNNLIIAAQNAGIDLIRLPFKFIGKSINEA